MRGYKLGQRGPRWFLWALLYSPCSLYPRRYHAWGQNTRQIQGIPEFLGYPKFENRNPVLLLLCMYVMLPPWILKWGVLESSGQMFEER